MLTVMITAADIADRDAAKPLLWNLAAPPAVKLTWADGGYAGQLVTRAAGKLKPKPTLEIVSRPMTRTPSRSCPAGGVVERTLAWITCCRRTVRDYERPPTPRDDRRLGDDHPHERPPALYHRPAHPEDFHDEARATTSSESRSESAGQRPATTATP